jgi:hypothetical protein
MIRISSSGPLYCYEIIESVDGKTKYIKSGVDEGAAAVTERDVK